MGVKLKKYMEDINRKKQYDVYYENGVLEHEIIKNGLFHIIDTHNDFQDSRFFYDGDRIINALENALVGTYDVFTRKILGNYKELDELEYLLPIWVTKAGLDSDFFISKEQFEYFCNRSLKPEIDNLPKDIEEKYKLLDSQKNKYLYLADCHFLVDSIQELIISANTSFINFYKDLCNINVCYDFVDDYWTSGYETRLVFADLSNIFISLHSCLDIITKVCYELEHLQECEINYPKLSSRNTIYRPNININLFSTDNTIFEKNIDIQFLMNVRNDIIHNCGWEMNPKVFIKICNQKLVDKTVYMMDVDKDGNIVKSKTRNRFYSQSRKLNLELDSIYFSILELILNTVQKINQIG